MARWHPYSKAMDYWDYRAAQNYRKRLNKEPDIRAKIVRLKRPHLYTGKPIYRVMSSHYY